VVQLYYSPWFPSSLIRLGPKQSTSRHTSSRLHSPSWG